MLKLQPEIKIQRHFSSLFTSKACVEHFQINMLLPTSVHSKIGIFCSLLCLFILVPAWIFETLNLLMKNFCHFCHERICFAFILFEMSDSCNNCGGARCK